MSGINKNQQWPQQNHVRTLLVEHSQMRERRTHIELFSDVRVVELVLDSHAGTQAVSAMVAHTSEQFGQIKVLISVILLRT